MSDLILTNAMIVLETEVIHGSLRVADGLIAAIDPGHSAVRDAIDCGGDLVLPGLVELHTDNVERHIEPRPKVDWPHGMALVAHDGELAACGITTVFDAMRLGALVATDRVSESQYARKLADELLDLRRRGALKISHLLHLRAEVCSDTLLQELASFGPLDGVGIVSLMDHTPGQRQFRDLSRLKAYICGKHGLSDAQFADHVTTHQALYDRVGVQHEAAAVAAALRYGATLASHDDTTAEQVATSARNGVRFAEFPTTLEAAQACRAMGIAVMMGAPNLIRGGSHSGNVAARDLAEADLLDILSSDYVPAGLLPAALFLGDLWDNLARGVATVTAAPARAAGLSDRGCIAIGLRADLARVARLGTLSLQRGTWVAGHRVA